MKGIKWLDEHFEEALLSALLIFIVTLMGVQIVARYVFNNSLSWSEELTRYAFVWSAFISIGYCIKNKSAIKIEQAYKLFPKKIQKMIDVLSFLVMFIFIGMLLKSSIGIIATTIKSGQRSSALRIPMYYVQMSSLVGFALAEIRLVQDVVKRFRKVDVEKTELNEVKANDVIKEGA